MVDHLLGLVWGVELLGKQHAGGLEDLFAPPQLGILLAELLQRPQLGAGQAIIALAGIGLGLADPAPQGFLVDAQVAGEVRNRTACGTDLTDGKLAELIEVLTWCRRCCGSPYV
ncbi:hypothetical protein KNE206_52370 [Kitasatospora sp. NE20-6]